MKNINKTKGYTLIEFMVAITIGLILLGGLSYVFLGMKSSNAAQSGLAELQENGRFALYFMTNDIQRAGWSDVDTEGYGIFTTPYISFASDLTLDGGNSATSDRITVRYQSDEDCLGAGSGSDGIAENTFFVDANGQLMCSGTGIVNAQPLIRGVEAMHLQYGIDTDDDFTPNRFVKQSEIDPSEYEKISAVRIILLLASSTDVHKTNTSQSFTISGESVALTFNDRKIRKIFSSMITIPNKPIFAL